MALTEVAAALGIIEKTSKGLNSVRERAKTSTDTALKENISNLYDDFLDLKAMVLRLTEENADLRRKLTEQADKPQKPTIRQVGETNYYFVGDEGPYCQPCCDDKGEAGSTECRSSIMVVERADNAVSVEMFSSK